MTRRNLASGVQQIAEVASTKKGLYQKALLKSGASVNRLVGFDIPFSRASLDATTLLKASLASIMQLHTGYIPCEESTLQRSLSLDGFLVFSAQKMS